VTAFDRLIERPWGPHDPATWALSLHLRGGPAAGKLVLLALPGGRCALGRLPERRFGAIERLGPEYDTALDGERDILRRRHEAQR
jgi:hypothetical protein